MNAKSVTTIAARRAVLLLIGLLVLAMATPVAAGEFDLGFGMSWMELESKDDSPGGEDARAELRLGYLFSERYEIEAQLIHVLPVSVFDDDFRYAVMLNGVFHFPTQRQTVPYLLVGAGWIEMDGPSQLFSCSPGDGSVAYQVAAGARFYPEGHSFSVRVEASALSEDTFDERSVHVSLTAGMSWRFGGGR